MTNHAIIAGFGLPGRMAAEALETQGVAYIVIELNPETAERIGKGGVHVVAGDVRDLNVLRAAHLETAALLVLAVPDDLVVLTAIDRAREVNPAVKIVARCTYTSSGLEAAKRGAAQTVIAEQLVALEVSRVVAKSIGARSDSER
jgi:CPA2 family monovalent cation:H+ antiporter-2